MPFQFSLPTTSRLNYHAHLISSTHPSLPAISTTYRNALYSALKSHKRQPASTQSREYQALLNIIQNYIPYLLSIDAALSSKPVVGEDIEVVLITEVQLSWRTTLASTSIRTTEAPKIKGKGLDYEIFSALHLLATLYSLIARQSLSELYGPELSQPDERLAAVQSATKNLATAYSIHQYLEHRSHGLETLPQAAIDVSTPAQSALVNVTQAEVALCFVFKDDPYPSILLQSRNKDDKEWMIKAPDIPKLRAQVLARLCISAGERAANAASTLKAEGTRFSKDFITYCEDLSRTSKAKACRFLGIDADLGGETGKAIAWLRAGMNELGIEVGKPTGFSKLKASWQERRDDRRIEMGIDGGMAEESRILEWLHQKWIKMNDTINVQLVPDWKSLSTKLPSGRDVPISSSWTPPLLTEEELARLRAPPDVDDRFQNSDSSDGETSSEPVGAFPGTSSQYRSGSEYY